MEHVTGIGGLFFRSTDPETLGRWYQEHFGIGFAPSDYTQEPWSQDLGPTAFAPFPKDTAYFGSTDKQWMLNLRVRNLDTMVEQLRSANIEVSVDPESYPNGRFARLNDPEGNPIELWESR